MGSEELKEAIRKLWMGKKRRGKEGRKPRVASPESAFDAVVEERLKELEASMRELKAKVNGLIFAVAGAVLTEVVLKIVR